MFTPAQTTSSPTSFQMPTGGGGGASRQGYVLAIGGGIVLLLIIGGVFWLRSRGGGENVGSQVSQMSSTVSSAKSNPPSVPTSVVQVVYPKDVDSDGLSDEEEQRLGTNPQNADSDVDGMSDAEEVIGRKTNPLAKDPIPDHPVARGYQP